MLIHFWHLFWRSLCDFPSLLSGNWLGAILLPLGLYVLFEFKPLHRGWSAMTIEAKKEFWRNSGLLVGVYLLLFVWVVVKDVYQDHEDLVRRISDLAAPPPELDARITGMFDVLSKDRKDGIVVVVLDLQNAAEKERSISNWTIQISLNSGPAISPNFPFLMPGPAWKIPGGHKQWVTLYESRSCPATTENPLPGGASRECWFAGSFKGWGEALSRSNSTATVGFIDGLTRKPRTITFSMASNSNTLFQRGSNGSK